jgi:hypothetical protein
LLIVSPALRPSWPLSGRNSTYPAVQVCQASSGQYAVVNGVYSFAPADAGSTVLLTYGYVPADLASCCMDWAAERYAYRSRIGQHSKSLGGQETMGQADALRGALEARIQQRLSGEVLQTRSGALAASIISSIENDGANTSVSISSTGVPYAAIQEFGGKTAAHDIVAVKGKVLAFSAGARFSQEACIIRAQRFPRALISAALSRRCATK